MARSATSDAARLHARTPPEARPHDGRSRRAETGALDRGSRTYNLGNGRGFSVMEVIRAAREVTGHPIPSEIGPRRPGDPAILIADSDQIMAELGWEPRFTDLREIIETAWKWHQRHPEGYES